MAESRKNGLVGLDMEHDLAAVAGGLGFIFGATREALGAVCAVRAMHVVSGWCAGARQQASGGAAWLLSRCCGLWWVMLSCTHASSGLPP
eukprot:COSAG01_NODE_7635_length_3119_cov_1.967550_4_plen_90_part_00